MEGACYEHNRWFCGCENDKRQSADTEEISPEDLQIRLDKISKELEFVKKTVNRASRTKIVNGNEDNQKNDNQNVSEREDEKIGSVTIVGISKRIFLDRYIHKGNMKKCVMQIINKITNPIKIYVHGVEFLSWNDWLVSTPIRISMDKRDIPVFIRCNQMKPPSLSIINKDV